ncbi:hypothetical protein CROQUDRAFT_135174 [Cronartium quercuum f. sp. fusiforme G11]|uniref:Glucanase n=1 Tax=Cronartium quercuum f. sp. fusiforme G11 TaxID=708437 RepID=A0A9P6NGE3_9BASI|nr:hypothetical protein CROQUDRAFT_135174 [Cronartium quercuum f. sp. fusiforme G11]
MHFVFSAVFFYLFTTTHAQLAGTQTPENRPKLDIQNCTKAGCTKISSSVTLDANWRWLHSASNSTNCYKGQDWDKSLCPNGEACAANCALDGADYTGTYGITTTGDGLKMKFISHGPYSVNVGSRVYLMDGDDKYAIFKLKNQEFSFDVDVSNLPCGLNGALYFAEMDPDGGKEKYPSNKAGAKYGTGYCDAQCPHDVKFIGGKANLENWVPSKTDINSGTGKLGSCCAEFDVWEANSVSQAFTSHSCTSKGPTICEGKACGDTPDNRYGGHCDKDGCDYATYRLGQKDFYGPNKTIDTTKKITVVTQFITHDNKTTGHLVEIRRLYLQDGKLIKNVRSGFKPLDRFDSISKKFCKAEKKLFGDKDDFSAKGGLKSMGRSMERGMVLVLSLWDDHTANMIWLDSNDPQDKNASLPGVARGTCDATSGDPKVVESKFPDASVEYSNIKFGELHSTYGNDQKS